MTILEMKEVSKSYGKVHALREFNLVVQAGEWVSEGHTIIVVTHDPEVGMLAERTIKLEHGK